MDKKVARHHAGAGGWQVYIARCADGTLYTGVARDAARRLAAHNRGKGAAYTRARRPLTLLRVETEPTRSAALSREWAIKQLSRSEKEELVKKAQANADSFRGFRPAALEFLRKLKRRNEREWFERNRAIYEAEVRTPLRALVEELDVGLARVAPEIVGDPQRSIFRIHRDIRFSRDKSPYKTHAACWLYHRDAGKGVGQEAGGGAGFYFHFSPGECLVAGGIWMPPRPALGRIRDALVQDLQTFEAVVRSRGFRRRFGDLGNEAMLKRLPRGTPPGHPAGPWLRYQSFTASRPLSRREVLSPRLPEILLKDFAALTPLVRWLNSALGYSAASAR